MFVTWRRRRLGQDGYRPTRCRHAHACPTIERWRLTPIVAFSLRTGTGAPRQEVVWRPRVSINSCCLQEPRARELFWRAFDMHLEALRKPPLSESSGAVVLDRLEWLRTTIEQVVPPVTDDEYAEQLETSLRGSAPAGSGGEADPRLSR